jgi:hypothetical protein
MKPGQADWASSGVRTWMPSFLIWYQRLRSETPRILAARACTPWVCGSASRIAPLPLLERLVERAR